MEGITEISGANTEIIGMVETPDYKEKFHDVCEDRDALERELIEWRKGYKLLESDKSLMEEAYQRRIQQLIERINKAEAPTRLQRLGNSIKRLYTWTLGK